MIGGSLAVARAGRGSQWRPGALRGARALFRVVFEGPRASGFGRLLSEFG